MMLGFPEWIVYAGMVPPIILTAVIGLWQAVFGFGGGPRNEPAGAHGPDLRDHAGADGDPHADRHRDVRRRLRRLRAAGRLAPLEASSTRRPSRASPATTCR
jgi:hypothetical protein